MDQIGPRAPPSFRGALYYNPYICSAGPAGLPQRCLGSTFVPGEALRGPFGKILDPKMEIREHHWNLKSDFGGSKTPRPRTKMGFSTPPHCFRCNARPQHGFQRFPRHLSTATCSWGRRQWAQPSRVYHFGDQGWGSGPKTPPALAISNLAVYRAP